jgi:hypothetical protein
MVYKRNKQSQIACIVKYSVEILIITGAIAPV